MTEDATSAIYPVLIQIDRFTECEKGRVGCLVLLVVCGVASFLPIQMSPNRDS